MSDIVRNLTEIVRYGIQYKASNLAPHELKAIHASYLVEICNCPGISQDQLAKRVCLSKSNVARQIAILEEAGFILRNPSETDRRVMELYPTEKATALLPDIQDMFLRWEQHLTGDLSESETALLSGILQKMKQKATLWMEVE